MLRTGKSPDITRGFDHSLSSYNSSTHGPQISVFLETISKASNAFIAKQYHQALEKYRAALNIISEIGCCKEYENIIQYMLCIIWLESTLLQDLLEALKYLCKLERSIGDHFPAVYYALGKTHMKLYRFEAAQKSINKGFDFLNKDKEIHSRCIPGTDIKINESTRQGLSDALIKLSDECSGWHPPDAVCSLKECRNFLDCYPQPNKNIFYSDPAFKGMVVITCSNNAFPCVMKFHQACWEYQKKQMSVIKKFSDKDVLGQKCFTPNCESGNIPNTIIKIEVYGEDAQLKATIEGSNPVVWPTKITSLKGAIKKQLPSTPVHKLRRPNLLTPPQQKEVNGIRDQKEKISDESEIAWRVAKLEDLREINFGITSETNWVPDQILYGNDHMMETVHFIDFDVINTQHAKMKVFIFDMFYEYIRSNGPLLVEDVLKKWQETQTIIDNAQHILTGFIDIIEFLLQSPKIVRLEDLMCTAYDLSNAYHLLENNTLRKFSFLRNDLNRHEDIELNNTDNETIPNKISCDNVGEDLSKIVSDNRTEISEVEGNALPKYINSTNLETFKNIESTERDTQVTKSVNDETESKIMNFESKGCFEDIEDDYDGFKQLFCTRFSPELINKRDDMNVDKPGPKNSFFINKNNNPFLDNDCQEEFISSNTNKDLPTSHDKDVNNTDSQVIVNNIKLPLQTDTSKSTGDLSAMNNNKKEDDFQADGVLKKVENLKQDDEDIGHVSEKNDFLRRQFEEEKKVLQEETRIKTQSILETLNVLKDEMLVLTEQKTEYENKIKILQQELEDSKDEISLLSKKLCDSETKNFNTKQKLLKDCLHHQFISNKHFIMGKMDVCNAVLEAFDNFILIFQRLSNFRFQPFDAEWRKLINKYHTLFTQHQAEYAQQSKLLDSAEEVEKMDGITLKLSSIPAFPQKSITDEVGDMFKIYHKCYSQMIQYPQAAAVSGTPLFMTPPLYMNRPPLFPPSVYQNNIPGLHSNIIPHQTSNHIINPPPMMQNTNFQTPTAKVPSVTPQKQQDVIGATENVKNDQEKKDDTSIKDTENFKVPEQNSAVTVNTETEVRSEENSETPSLSIKNVEQSILQDSHEGGAFSETDKQKVSPSHVVDDDKPNLTSTVSKSTDNLTQNTDNLPKENTDKIQTNLMSSKEKLNVLIMEIKEEIMGIMEKDKKRVNISDMDVYTTSEEEYSQLTQAATASNENRKCQQNAQSVSSKKRPLNPDASLHYQTLTKGTNDRQKPPLRPVQKAAQTQCADSRAVSSAKPVWIPITTPNEGWQKEYQESECVICMSSIKDEHKSTYTLRCKHTFHKVCIKDWFKQNQTCPNCRAHCIIDDEFPPLPI